MNKHVLGAADDLAFNPDTVHLELFGDRQSGKTEMIVRYLAGELVEGRRAIYFGTSLAVSRIVFERTKMLVLAMSQCCYDDLRFRHTNGIQEIEHKPTGSVVYFRTRRGGGGRGLSVDTVVLDDFDRERDAAAYANVQPCLNASQNPKLVTATCV